MAMWAFRLAGFYRFTAKIGGGTFGQVWSGTHIITGTTVAAKTDRYRPGQDSTLSYEAAVYKVLQGGRGIPEGHCLRRFCRGKLSLKTVLMIAEQMLSRIEFLHSRGIVYRDLKPDNLMMGTGPSSNVVYLIDFGTAKLYADPLTGAHMPYREGRRDIGTSYFFSLNTHLGREQSRRDDLEGLGYVLLYLYHGDLPWLRIYAPTWEAEVRRMGEMKDGKPLVDALAKCPPEFSVYFDYCRKLAFQGQPDYGFLKGLFRSTMEREGWVYDSVFDWSAPTDKGTLLPEEYVK